MKWYSCAATMVAALFLHWSAHAQDVTLSSADGTLTVSGDLIAYDGEYLRLETEFGPLTLDARGLTCTGPGCPLLSGGVAEVTIEGAQIVAERLFPAVLEAFARAQGLELTRRREGGEVLFDLGGGDGPVMRLRLRATSSDAGLLALVSGETDLALSLTPLQDPDFLQHVLALDAFVPVASGAGMIDRIAMSDLLALMRDAGARVPDGEGPDTELTLHLRNLESGEDHALGARLHAIGIDSLTEDAIRHGSNAGLVRAVGRDPFGLGMILLSQARDLSVVPMIDACGLPVVPEPFSLKAGSYPLTQPLYAIQLRQRLPLRLRQFLEFFASPEAGRAIRAAGFTEAQPIEAPAAGQGTRLIRSLGLPEGDDAAGFLEQLRAVGDLMLETRQLSLAFRFEPGTAQIDNTSLVNIRQLANAIEAGVHDGHEIVLVGFSDSMGDAEVNRDLSQRRAEAVRGALDEAAPLRDEARVVLSAEGLGILLPVACNDAEWGRAINRRVEVWLRALD